MSSYLGISYGSLVPRELYLQDFSSPHQKSTTPLSPQSATVILIIDIIDIVITVSFTIVITIGQCSAMINSEPVCNGLFLRCDRGG